MRVRQKTGQHAGEIVEMSFAEARDQARAGTVELLTGGPTEVAVSDWRKLKFFALRALIQQHTGIRAKNFAEAVELAEKHFRFASA